MNIMAKLNKIYNPKEIEQKWYQNSVDKGYFHSDESSGKPPYTIVIPPPNVTGVLHMGHALNNTIQDILIRYYRMKGHNALWMPGTDHAGIATQNVVERKLKKEGKRKEDLGRDAFIEDVWDWKAHHGGVIINQLKTLGASCDWDRERFTMDEGLSDAVRCCFHDLYHKDLVYRGNYITNWCPRCQTALSDEESEHKDVKGAFYYLRYPIEGSDEFIEIATTRPETMFGDTAVAMNPNDERYQHLKGKRVILPIINKSIPLIENEHVDPEFGTGLVKVTPAHDPNDFEMGQIHDLELVSVMTGDAKMEQAGPYEGMDRFECRKQLVEDLKEQGLLLKVEDHDHSVGHCYRCDTVVEPRASKQWFVRMKPLAEKALAAEAAGKVKFYPEKWRKIYVHWLSNIRDWCISRQIWWGHQIPVWYCGDCEAQTVTLEDPTVCSSCGSENLTQETDVLDTWFSSWLWPFSTLGWPEKTKDLETFYPTQTLVTAPDILFFWVSRMIMAGLEFMGEVPFKDVYLHGVVRDEQGRKMSKSLGNSIDPLEAIEEYSADALRFSLMMLAPLGHDLQLSQDKFVLGRNFANKIWNAARYLLMNVDKEFDRGIKVELMDVIDHWIVSRLNTMLRSVSTQIEKFRFNDAVTSIYDFLWHDFCDWYLEMIKDRMDQNNTQQVALNVLEQTLCALHPIMPFVTEEIWSLLPLRKDSESIVVAAWPKADATMINPEIEAQFAMIKDIIQAARNVRRELNLPLKQELDLVVSCEQEQDQNRLQKRADVIIKLAKLSALDVVVKGEKLRDSRAIVREYGTVYVKLKNLIDTEVEKERLHKEVDKVNGEIKLLVKKLSNQGFVAKAPEKVIQKERDKQAIYEQLKDQLLEQLGAF